MTNNGQVKFASRELFLAPAKRRYVEVFLSVAQIWVRIRSLFEGEKEAYEAGLLNAKGDVTKDTVLNARRRLIAMCLVDADGERLLSDADVEAMKQLDPADMAALQEQCQILCGFKNSDIESLTKNSEAAQGDS